MTTNDQPASVGGQAPASAVILAGGMSRRLGHDKRQLRLWGEHGPTLLERTVATAGALCADVVVVLNDPEAWAALPARIVGDRYPDGGALGGIISGLEACRESHALVLACDMPLLSPPLLRAMLAHPRDYDALVPRSPDARAVRNSQGIEPLHAIYARSCLGPLRAALESGRRQIAASLAGLRVAYLEPEQIRRLDPQGFSFLNINTVAQIAAARRLLESPTNS